ncbi:MAG: hypothetical protein IKF52_03540 [Clostridia bacterium]|nr:hypothetical protein [Clostridia bacterium]
MNENYEDIINLPHQISSKHPHMSIEMRAAQFAPYAALTGYGDAVKETGRLTNQKIELNEEQEETIRKKLQDIKDGLKEEIMITYFVPDLRKDGGEYKVIGGIIKKIDEYKNLIIMEDKTEIQISDIIEIMET